MSPGLLVGLCLAAAPAEGIPGRSDVVTMTNGDRMTGEIKRLYQGLLELKTDHAGTLQFEWPSVESIESRNPFEVVLDDGRRLYGSLRPAGGRQLEVVGRSPERVGLAFVVEIEPLERTFWAQLAGSTSLGFSFSQSNSSTTWTASANVEYLTRRYLLAVNGSSYLDAQAGADTTTRNVAGAVVSRLLPDRWRIVELNELLQSDQLGIRRRLTLGCGVQHDVVHTNHNVLTPTAAVAYSHTDFDEATPGQDEVLALLGLEYSVFTFGHHKTTFHAVLRVLPSLSEGGHIRVDLDGRLRVKLFRDFYWSADFYENYDNGPPQGNGRNDVGVSVSLAWTF